MEITERLKYEYLGTIIIHIIIESTVGTANIRKFPDHG